MPKIASHPTVKLSALTVAPAHRGLPRTKRVCTGRSKPRTVKTSEMLDRYRSWILEVPSAARAYDHLDDAMKRGEFCIIANDPALNAEEPIGLYLIWNDGCYRLATSRQFDESNPDKVALDMRFPTLLSALVFGFYWWDNAEIFFGESDDPHHDILRPGDHCYICRIADYDNRLHDYFQTVEVTTYQGTTLTIISDGRAGNGFEHWREVKIGTRTVADLTGDKTGPATVTVANKKGDLRKGTRHEFQSFKTAVEYLRLTF